MKLLGKSLGMLGVFFLSQALITGKHYVYFNFLDVNILFAILIPYWYGCYWMWDAK